MSVLTLPRELYLIVCSYLSPLDLAILAGMSKDYYISVQEPLFSHIDISSFGKLVKLVGTLTKPPVVSQISARQRLRWQSLSDAQLREREVKRLNILLDLQSDSNVSKPVNGELLSRCIGAISRCRSGVRIHLSLQGPWHGLLLQMQSASLPDVCELVLYLGGEDPDPAVARRARHTARLSLWEICFSGSALPDLQVVEFDTHHSCRKDLPTTISKSAKVSLDNEGYDRFQWEGKEHAFEPFCGLKKMKSIKLQYNSLLDEKVLNSLLGSNIIPQNLTHLEIVGCPLLWQTDLAALSMLLQRGLQLLQHLKLHLQPLPRHGRQYNHIKYVNDIEEHPEHHLCNVIREVGQNIKSLDIALPLACSHIFVPPLQDGRQLNHLNHGEMRYPIISREPAATLPARLIAEGYRYRRLICWDGFCRDGGKWEEMHDLASVQGEKISWEIVSVEDKSGSWHVSGCLPVDFPSKTVLERQLAEEER